MTIEKDTSTKISWIQFICAIVVVFDHCFDYIDYEHTTKNAFESIIYIISLLLTKGLPYCAMAIFFFLSALLLFRDFDENNIKDWYIKKLKNRFKSLVIPYILWNTIWTILFLAVGILDKNNSTNIIKNPTITDFIKGVLFGTYNEVFWYLKTLIIYVLISPIIGIITKKYKKLILIIGFIIAIIPNLFTGELLIFVNSFNTLFFSLGAYISLTENNHYSKVHHNNHILSTIVLIVCLILITYIQGSNIKQNVQYIYVALLNITAVISSLLGTISFYNLVSDIFVNKPVKWYTRSSFLIYAMHKPVEQAFNKVVAKLFSPTLLAHLINVFGGTIFTIIVILIAIRIMYIVCPKLLNILNGERKIFN